MVTTSTSIINIPRQFNRSRTSDTSVVLKMDLDEELKGLRYLKLAPPNDRLLSPTLLPDRALKKWVKKEWGIPADMNSNNQRCSSSNTTGNFGEIRIVDKEELARIASMFCVNMTNDLNESRLGVDLQSVEPEHKSGNREKHVFHRLMSGIRRRLSRKIKPIV